MSENARIDELLKVTTGLDARFDSLQASVKGGFDSLHSNVGSLHSRFDAFGEGLLFVARKVLAEPEVRELRKILDGNTTAAKRSA
ncbi:MAG TPA: hypothetical protein VG477_17330 [Thermoanaerobaculia bacterium]|nr:hypothetical protein [Thermoanaerobaculia bacterium]